MAVESDEDRLALLSDFGFEVEIGGKSVMAIFDNEWQDGNGIAVTVPVLTVRTIDVEDFPRGQTIYIENKKYSLAEPMPDGQGMTHIVLQDES